MPEKIAIIPQQDKQKISSSFLSAGGWSVLTVGLVTAGVALTITQPWVGVPLIAASIVPGVQTVRKLVDGIGATTKANMASISQETNSTPEKQFGINVAPQSPEKNVATSATSFEPNHTKDWRSEMLHIASKDAVRAR